MKLPITAALLVTAASAHAVQIPLSSAGTTHSQPSYGPEKTIDSAVTANNGWAVDGGEHSAQRIWWNASGIPASTSIRRFHFLLNFRGTTGSFQEYHIKRFVLAYTTDAVVSNNSNWISLSPVSAITSTPATATLSINSSTSEVSLIGGSGSPPIDYFVTADTAPSAVITGFSLRALPVSGTLGTTLGGNFVLTEFSIDLPPPLIIVPPNITISEDDPLLALKLTRSDTSTPNFNVVGTVSGSASFPADYTRSFSANHAFTFVGSSSESPFSLGPINDALNEPAETVIITWTPNASYTLSSPTTTITIGDTDGSGFDDYIAGHGLVGNDALPDADPNNDGISNIEAYAFRLNPAGPFPAAWRERLPQFTTSSGGRFNFPAITWQLPQPFPEDVRFTVTESDELLTWPDVAQRNGYGVGALWTGTTSATIEDSGTPLKTVIVRGSQAISARPKAFLRLALEPYSNVVSD